MNRRADHLFLKSRRVKPWMYTAALLVNVLVFICIGWVYNASDQEFKEKLAEENINSVENLNAASANAAYTYTNGMKGKIDDIIHYIKVKEMTYGEAVVYLHDANTDPDRQLQIVHSGSIGETGQLSFGDYSGISFRQIPNEDGTLETVETPISYGSGYYDILRFFTDVNDEDFDGLCFAPEFTDPDTKTKCFAVYQHAALVDEKGNKGLYTILLVISSEKAMDDYGVQIEYKGQSTVLVNSEGDYLVKNSDFRNVNFFDYIVNYNGLTLDWKTQIQEEVASGTSNGSSVVNLFYKNHQGADCVFSVAAIENGWYSITCVPLSSFNEEDDSINYSFIILLLFVILFVIDGLAIYFIGKVLSYNVAVAEKATQDAITATQAKSRFLSTMSHELRTPLNAIIGLVALSRDSLESPTVLKDYLKKIDISSKLLLQLISDILDVSAIESNKLKLNNGEMDITKLITSLSAIYYDQCAAKGIEFNVAIRNMHSEIIIGDSVRVNQILLNFLSNAVKFTPSGGKVTLCAEQLKREDETVMIHFEVRDTGCGISEELRSRLFKPFERASGTEARKYSGTGLGLSIAKNIVALMDGQVGVESTEGVGSVFWADIPFGISKESSRKSFSPIANLHVLAVVSDEDERKYIGQIFSGLGVKRIMAGSAEEALKLLREARQEKNPFNLCMLDWKMSDLNGLDLTRAIRREFSSGELRIILLAYNLAEANAECADAGADLVFGKPVFPSALYNLLEELTSNQIRIVPGPERSYDLSGKRVLLVEDNKLNTEIACLLLEKVGIEVETAENGKLGCDAFLDSETGYFDAILMDIQMPVMDGYQATTAIRASEHPQAQTIPILAMTADAFTEDVEKAHDAGMDEHIAKPVVPENLYALLKLLLC